MKQIVGLLGWIGIALVVGAVGVRIFKPELDSVSRALAIAGLVVTVLYALTQWRDIGRSFQGKNAQYGSVAVGSIVVFLAIVVGLNYVVSRRNVRWDLTASKAFTLSDQTKQILSRLQAPLKIEVYYDPRTDTPDTYALRMENYKYQSPQVTVEYVNILAERTRTVQAEIAVAPTFILEYGGRKQRANSADEQAVTNALKRVIEGQAKKAYFIQGHGERDPDDSSTRDGFKTVSVLLTNDNFEVAKLTLLQKGSIPADTTLLVIAGPMNDFSGPELELVRAYLRQGGRALVMIDPASKNGTVQPAGLIALMREWGIALGDDVVWSSAKLAGLEASVVVANPVPHAITQNFRAQTGFPLARSVSPIDGGVEGRVAQALVQSGPESWAETDLKAFWASSNPQKDVAKGDKTGPVTLGAAVSARATDAPPPAEGVPAAESRLVVFGDSDFLSNESYQLGGNLNLFLNAVNWLAKQEDFIAIRPRDPEDSRMQLSQTQINWILGISIGLIPALLFGNAVRVYRKRR